MTSEGYSTEGNSIFDFNKDGEVNFADLATGQAVGIGALVFGATYYFVSKSKNATISKLIREKRQMARRVYTGARTRFRAYRRRWTKR